jgi:N-acetyl-anhydromuramyl-L-alanine amidase AmpD
VTIPFVQAKYYTPTSGRSIDLIVLHDMETPERLGVARNVANWFAGTTAPRASAHYCIDSLEIIQCVKDKDVAWHAPGANHNSIGVEHAGYAAQRADQWRDAYSTAELQLSAELVRGMCATYGIPVMFLDAAELLRHRPPRGITTHNEVSEAYRRSDHWDPGPNFPIDWYLAMVRDAGPAPSPAPAPGPVHDYEEAATKTTMVHVGKLDSNGNGHADWQPGLGRDPIIVGVVQHGPSPPDDGYWPQQAKVNLSAQPRGGAVRVVVRGGTPGDTVTAWVTVA